MRDLYSDDYESVAGDGADRLIPEGVAQAGRRGGLPRPGRGHGPLVLPARHPRRRRGADHPGDGRPGPGRAGRSRRPAGRPPGPRGQRRARRAARRRCRETPPRPSLRPPPLAAGGRAAGRAGARARRRSSPSGSSRRTATCRCPGRRTCHRARQPAAPEPERPISANAAAAAMADAEAPPIAAGPRPRNRPANLPVASRQAPRRPRRWRRTGSARRAGRRSPRAAREVVERQARHPAGAARRLRQRGDHPHRPGRSWSPATATCSARRASTSSARPPTRGCSTGCASPASRTPSRPAQMCEALRARGIDCIPVTLQ